MMQGKVYYCVYSKSEFAMDEDMQLYLMKDAVGEILPLPPPLEATQQPRHGSSALQHPHPQHHPQRQQQQQQQQQLAEEVVSSHDVRPTDVFCSRDKASHSHPGNKRFRQLIVRYREQYQNLNQREEKTQLTNDIVNAIKNNGGRFLKQHESIADCWYEVNYTVAHEKVSHALRSAKDPNRPKAQKATRKPSIKPPTQDEDRAFELLAREQQQIFASFTTTTAANPIIGETETSTVKTIGKSSRPDP
jgi:hypothetical protein